MTGATLCSGIGAPETAMPWIDWRWCAEVEKFPSAVLAARHGHMNLGDITAPDFIERAQAMGPIDLLVAGTPCQAFSVAGLRRSLEDDRGNLTLRFVEIVNAIEPRFTLWENVPGVLSTADNAFGCFLAGMVGADSALVPARGQRWTDAGVVAGPKGRAAWRILDAQYFGLAQRRERVFVVRCPGDGADPAEVLFEREGVQRHSPPRREAREGITGTLSARTKGGGGLGTDFDLDGGLVSKCLNGGAMRRIDAESETLIASTLKSNNGGGGFGSDPSETFITHSLRAECRDASEDGTGRGVPLVAATLKSNGDGGGLGSDPSENFLPVAFQESQTGTREYDTAGTLRSDGPGHDPVGTRVRDGMAVRRLTPTECERLQGFPDGYTQVEYRVKEAADGPRYRALGNSMAVPVIAWIGRRILEAERTR